MKKVFIIIFLLLASSFFLYYSLLTENFRTNPELYKGECPVGFYIEQLEYSCLGDEKGLDCATVMPSKKCVSYFEFLSR